MNRLALALLAASLVAIPQERAIPLHERPELGWWRESMKTRDQRLAWWRHARFGMFIHWGVYSVPAGIWEGKPVSGYAEHIQRMRKIPIAVYREQVAARFNPVRFNAEEWVTAAKRAGMGYLIITAKHHDGFAMYDSAVGDYTIMKATPWGKTGRDPMRELKEACVKHGLHFGFYYSHAFDWGEANGAGNDWEYENPGGDRLLHGANWWEKAPELLPRIRRYVDGKAIPQVRELIRKYDPDIMWFDTPHKLPVDENLRILRAAREAKPTIVLNGRAVQPIPGGPTARFGDYASTADRPAEFLNHEGDWEAIPTTNESYGHHQADVSHKPPEHFVRLLANAAARGGNLLLNIGPRGDGAIDSKDLAILDGITGWMSVNGDSIRGTERTPLPVQTWGHSTRKGRRLYLHVLDWPTDGRLYLAGLRSPIAGARLLGAGSAPLPAARRVNADDVELTLPAQRPDPWNSIIVVDSKGPLDANPVLHIDPVRPTTLHVFQGALWGPGIRYGDGKRLRDTVMDWKHVDSGVGWKVRASVPGRYRLTMTYTTAGDWEGGGFDVIVGDHGWEVTAHAARPGTFRTAFIADVTLKSGLSGIGFRPGSSSARELMRLRSIELIPLAPRRNSPYAELPDAVRRVLASLGVVESTFDSFVRRIERRTRERLDAGEREALVYYILQSSAFTSLPPIEPARSAKLFVQSEDRATPENVSRRFDAFIAAKSDISDERFEHFARVLPRQANARVFLRTAYDSAMRFLYEKEFGTPKARVPLLYQERAHSTDTAFEANFPVDHALHVIARLAPGVRLNRALIVGPGLDLAPRTDLMDGVAPQSTQPFAVADSLLASKLADRSALRLDAVDISDAVVSHLNRFRDGEVHELAVYSGLTDGPPRPLSQEYRRYFNEFGAHIGTTPTLPTAARKDSRLFKTIQLHPEISRAISAERLNIVTERSGREYDLVVATNVFPYLTEAELALALANASSMLRPGGYLIHNEGRANLPIFAAAAGLEAVQVRGLVLTSGAHGAISDTIWIHTKALPANR